MTPSKTPAAQIELSSVCSTTPYRRPGVPFGGQVNVKRWPFLPRRLSAVVLHVTAGAVVVGAVVAPGGFGVAGGVGGAVRGTTIARA